MNQASIFAASLLFMLLAGSATSAGEPQSVYDADGNLVEIRGGQQATGVYFAYDKDGNLVRTRDENGEITDYLVDQDSVTVD